MYGYKSTKNSPLYKLFDRRPSDILDRTVREIKSLPADSRVLNLGCGDGILERLAGLDRAYNFTSVDIEPGAIENLKNVFLANKHTNKDEAYVGDVTKLYNLPITLDKNFDVIISWRVLHGIDPKYYNDTLSVIYTALKPGGRFIISVASDRDWKREALGSSYQPDGINDCSGVMFRDFNIDRTTPFPVHFFQESELSKLGEVIGFTLENQEYFQEPSGYSHLQNRPNTYLFASFVKKSANL